MARGRTSTRLVQINWAAISETLRDSGSKTLTFSQIAEMYPPTTRIDIAKHYVKMLSEHRIPGDAKRDINLKGRRAGTKNKPKNQLFRPMTQGVDLLQDRCAIRNLTLDGYTKQEIVNELAIVLSDVEFEYNFVKKELSQGSITDKMHYVVVDGTRIGREARPAHKPVSKPVPQPVLTQPTVVLDDSMLAQARQAKKDAIKAELRHKLALDEEAIRKEALEEVLKELQ